MGENGPGCHNCIMRPFTFFRLASRLVSALYAQAGSPENGHDEAL
jgi:hypothetical protein